MRDPILYDDDPRVEKVLTAHSHFYDACDKSGIEGLTKWADHNESALLDELQATSWEERPIVVGQLFLVLDRSVRTVPAIIQYSAQHMVIEVNDPTGEFAYRNTDTGEITFARVTSDAEEMVWKDTGMVEGIVLIHEPRCMETLGMLGDKYVRCNKHATMLVKHLGREEGPYWMCDLHGTHNVYNRGGAILRRK